MHELALQVEAFPGVQASVFGVDVTITSGVHVGVAVHKGVGV